MSGGRFDYLQYRFTEIIDAIEQEIRDNNAEPREEDWFFPHNYREETIEKFKEGIKAIKIAQAYAQRIDWLLSSDDLEDSFHIGLIEDLKNI